MRSLYYLVCVIFFLGGLMTDAHAKDSGRVVFDFFLQPDAATQWQIVNDGVMGGRSTSSIEILGDAKMRFTGTLSLENNGGFASVRSKPNAALSPLGLKSGDTIVMRVMGDGRKYTFNLYVPDRRMALSHQLEFQTEASKWTEIQLPIDRFAASLWRAQTDRLIDKPSSMVGS